MAIDPNCPRCRGVGWTCEVHVGEPMDHDQCNAAGVPCELCCRVGELPELPPGFVPSYAIDALIDAARSAPAYTATGRLGPANPAGGATAVSVCPTCGQTVDMSDIVDVLYHAAREHDPRRYDA